MTENETNESGALPNLLVERKDGYAILTLNREEKRNALSRALLSELQAAMNDLRDYKVIILTGTGDRAFCAGMDLKEALPKEPERIYANGHSQFFELLESMRRHPAIFIAAVNGFALGGGLTLTHNSELALAAEHATFGMPEIGFGVFPALAGPTTAHRIAPKHAAWMVLLGGRTTAEMAERWGIVNEVVPADQLMARAEELAQRIAQFDSIALDFSKKALREVVTLDWSRAIDYGFTVNDTIARHTAAGEEGLTKFANGERSVGQGANEG